MNKIYTLLLICLVSISAIGQNSQPTSQSNASLKFNDFLAGVKYAEVLTTPEQEQLMVNNPNAGTVYLGVTKYLKAMNFTEVGFSSKFRGSQLPSECDKALILVQYDVSGSYINNFTVTFYSCDQEWWQFKSSSAIINNGWGTIEDKVYNKFRKMYGYGKPTYNKFYRRELPSKKTNWTEYQIKEHFKKNGADPIEGIYERTSEEKLMARYKVGIIKEDNEYKMVYLGGALNYEDWSEGEIKAELTKTATPTLFKLKWRMANKSINEDPYATFETGLMNIVWPDGEKGLYIKLYPSQTDNISISNNAKSSGTGFALSSNGYIITNYHVIEGANKIQVRGVKGNFSKTYSAEIVVEDKNNDIAIIQITDPNFTSLGQIPYTFNTDLVDVGKSVYALGYPLRASMGDEVKLTNGIISSKTGFQGDITTYQISVPVQPGNSGGPLINKQGEIVGIINAKHLAAENASYAIKSSYLMNLIQIMNTKPSLPRTNIISSKELSEQVKFVKEFVYILEIN
ncbi:S1C family serine protease [Phaeodactylibacter xiamenensis]|uniref:S1C family serine protease n=1 Tax=Phaeodactylibacter xiamenensis TaxID=1524460 RepID=UPI003CCBA0A8